MRRHLLITGLLLASLIGVALAQHTGPIGQLIGRTDADNNLMHSLGAGYAAVDELDQAIVVGPVEEGASGIGQRPLIIGGLTYAAVPSASGTDGFAKFIRLTPTGDVHTASTASTVTNISVGDETSTTAILAASTTRLDFVCTNQSTAILYLRWGAAAVAATATEIVMPGGQFFPNRTTPRMALNGIWSANGGGTVECDVFSNQ